jgi:hypothetical protein
MLTIAPRAPSCQPLALLACLAGIAALTPANAARAIVLDDALSLVALTCVSVREPIDPIAAPVEYSCDGLWFWPIGSQSGPSRAFGSTEFGAQQSVSVRTENTGSPQEVSTYASSRVKYQLAVEQFATPPVNVDAVPIALSTAGNVVVSELGIGAAAGTYVSSTDTVSFASSDVFTHNAQSNRQFMPAVLADSYDIVETLDLAPGHVYFVNISAGCSTSRKGTWACDGHTTASFVLDQLAFDERMGVNSFGLSQYFALRESPNLVPEPDAAPLGMVALAAVACRSGRSRSGATRRAAAARS